MKNIMMNKEMAKATKNKTKTNTRRAVTKYYDITWDGRIIDIDSLPGDIKSEGFHIFEKKCPLFYSEEKDNYYRGDNLKYDVGDKLWIREPVKIDMCFTEEICFHYLADNEQDKMTIPKRFIKDGFIVDWMAHCNGVPNGCIKEMARIFVEITGVRVEKLQNITFKDVLKEGIELKNRDDLIKNDMLDLSKTLSSKNLGAVEIAIKNSFIKLWNSVAPDKFKWKDNRFVVVYDFKKVES